MFPLSEHITMYQKTASSAYTMPNRAAITSFWSSLRLLNWARTAMRGTYCGFTRHNKAADGSAAELATWRTHDRQRLQCFKHMR